MAINSTVKKLFKQGGYKRIGPGAYQNEAGHKVYPYNWVNGRENQAEWAERGKLPPMPGGNGGNV